MKLRESRQRNVHVFHLEDEVDLHYAPTLRALFQAKANQRCPALVVDLGGVPFIDSTGIAVLLEYLRDAAQFGGRFCLAAPTDHVRHVFEITRLNEALPVFADVSKAVVAAGNNSLPMPAQPLFEPSIPACPERSREALTSVRATG
jgi:anti-sigma B factor antagonist